MHITWHGQYTLKFQTNSSTLLIDPYASTLGLRPLRAQADIIILSNPDDETMSHTQAAPSATRILSGPGEYTVDGFSLHAMPWTTTSGNQRIIQRFTIENLCLLNVASLNRDLSDQELQEIEKTNIDVLVVPVGGGSALDAKQAIKLVTTIEPKLVIPVHYKLPKLKEKLDPVDEFAKQFGIDPSRSEKKIIVKANRLPQEDMETIILEP